MTVQSPREQAYSENDRPVFPHHAPTAIALDNARAYRELRGPAAGRAGKAGRFGRRRGGAWPTS